MKANKYFQMNNNAPDQSDAEFAEFQAWKAAKARQAASEPDRQARSPTLGRSSVPAPPNNDPHGRDTRQRALAMSSEDDQALEPSLHDDSESPPPRDRTVRTTKSGRNSAPKLPPSTPPVPPRSHIITRTSSPHVARMRESIIPRPLALAVLPRLLSPTIHPLPVGATPITAMAGSQPHPPNLAAKAARLLLAVTVRHLFVTSARPLVVIPARRLFAASRRQGHSPSPRPGHNTPNNVPGSNETADTVNDEEDEVDEDPYRHLYDQTPTSYVPRTHKDKAKHLRGGRSGRTFIEQLGDRLSKHVYTWEHMHPFARKHGLAWFDPYAIHKAPVECYNIVTKPKELVGGPGRGNLPLHEAAGMRMDMDFWNKIIQDTLAKYAPKNLPPDTKLTWSHYSLGARKALFNYCYNYVPMLQNFRNQAQGDCWLIAMIAQQHLQGRSPKLAVSKKLHPDMRPEEDGFQDSYSDNSRAPGAGSNAPARASAPRAPAPNAHRTPAACTPATNSSRVTNRSQAADHSRGWADSPRGRTTGTSHTQTQPASNARRNPPTCTPALDDYDDHEEPQMPPKSSSSRTYDHPPAPTERQNRKADKRAAAEEERTKTKASDSRASKNKAQVAITSRALGKPRAKPPQEPVPVVEEHEESEDEEVRDLWEREEGEGEPREHAKAKSPEPETQKGAKTTKKGVQTVTKVPPKTATKAPAKALAKAPTKRKADEEQYGERQELDSEPPKKRVKTTQATKAQKRKADVGNQLRA
ncbi:hypothetical protein FRC07_004193 [Ceratobasidium sp. 392]|nr:hypothetical protein FRC07_004193 [Ceratobasidium sp. 392]